MPDSLSSIRPASPSPPPASDGGKGTASGDAPTVGVNGVPHPHRLWRRIRSAEASAAAGRPLVLVVDDRAPDRLLMRDALRDCARTDSATTVDDAVRMASSTSYDAVIVAVSLPDDTGLSVLKRLRFRPAYRSVPIVAVTTHALNGDRERLLDAGFDASVAKPFEQDELAALVEDLLDDAAPTAERSLAGRARTAS